MRHGSCTPTFRTAQERLQGLLAMRSSPTAAQRACATSATRRRSPTTCSTGEALLFFSRSHSHLTVTAMLACVKLVITGGARQAWPQLA